MKGKAALIAGLATGYVLGTRDGRARYQQIKTQFQRIISDPRVQQKTSQAADVAKAKAPLVKDRLADATHRATGSSGSANGTGLDGGSRSGSDLSGDSSDDSWVDDASDPGTSSTDLTDTSREGTRDEPEAPQDGDDTLVTPPTPSPLAPGPTRTDDSTASNTGGSHG